MKKILILTGLVTLIATTGCVVFEGRHHTTVVAPIVPVPVPVVVVH